MSVTHPGTAVLPGTGKLDSTGGGTVRISPPPTGVTWRIHQLAVATNPSGVMLITVLMSGLPCMTPVLVQSGAAADGPPPIDVGSHDEMEVVISRGPAGATVTVSYFYEEIPG